MIDDRFLKHTIESDPIFQIHKLTDQNIQSLKESGVWKPDCPVPFERLRILTVSNWEFGGAMITDGQIMVLDAVAKSVLDLFKDLFECHFPIAKVQLMDHYRGDDHQSMEDNNTTCFNWRVIAGSSKASLHGYGLAIDINPIQNPFIQFPECEPNVAIFSPAAGRNYANRLPQRPNKEPREGMAEDILEVFYRHGFNEWGGHWDTPIDYHHFQVPRSLAEQLVLLDPAVAEQKFKEHIEQVRHEYEL
jgi:hypothetical protein